MSDLQTTESPTTMSISAFSGIGQKLNYLAQVIKDEKEAETRQLYIECYKEDRKINNAWQTINIIRLSVDFNIWTEINTYDKIDGAILPKNISVNLYDFFNIVDNCKDDIISFWIDEEEAQLVINSFYNEHRDQDELEVRLPIGDIGFNTRKLTTDVDDIGCSPLHTLELPPIMLYTIMAELNVEQKTDGIYISNVNGNMYFTSDYNGYKTQLNFKELNTNIGDDEWSYFVPFNLMSLISATGTISNLKLNFYADDVNALVVDTEDYKFSYPTSVIEYDITIPNEGEEFLVVESEMAQQMAALINRLNKPAPYNIYTIKKVDEMTAEVECVYKDRFAISVYTDMAMLCDKELQIDSRIFERIVTKNMVDAVKFELVDDVNTLIKITTPVYEKKLYYKHEQFSQYRRS